MYAPLLWDGFLRDHLASILYTSSVSRRMVLRAVFYMWCMKATKSTRRMCRWARYVPETHLLSVFSPYFLHSGIDSRSTRLWTCKCSIWRLLHHHPQRHSRYVGTLPFPSFSRSNRCRSGSRGRYKPQIYERCNGGLPGAGVRTRNVTRTNHSACLLSLLDLAPRSQQLSNL